MTEDEGNQLLLSHTAWLHGLARSVVARQDLAADVAQETLLVAWRRGLGGVLDLRSYLATILRRLAGRHARGEQRRVAVEGSTQPPEPTPSPAELVAKASMQREVVDAVLGLDEPFRTTILLRYLEQRSPEQIAAATAAPLETVRTRLKRGLRQLRDDLDRRHGTARAWALPLLGIPGFDEAMAASTIAAASTATTAAVTGGVLLMSAQAKVGVGIAVVGVGFLAWQIWPTLDAREVAPANEVTSAVVVSAPTAAGAPTPASERSAVPPAVATPDNPAPPANPIWRVTGRVVDEASNGGVGAAVIRFTRDSSGRLVDAVATTTTAADGSFTFAFEQLTPGYLELEVQHADYGTTWVPLLEAIARAADARQVALDDVVLARGARLGGCVLAADGKTPIAGARVLHYRAHFGMPMRFFADAVEVASSDAAGRFLLPQRVAPGYRREWIAALTERGVGWRELQPSRRATENDGFDLVLRPCATLRLRVVDREGRPQPNVVAVAWPECMPLSSVHDGARQNPAAQPLPPFLLASTAADGVVTLLPPIGEDGMQYGDRVPGGRCTVLVAAPGFRQWRETLELQAGEQRELDVRLVTGAHVDVIGRITGRDGTPIAGATVSVENEQTASEVSGHFRLLGIDALAGTLPVRVVAAGYVATGRSVSLRDVGTEVRADFELAPARVVRGLVVDQDGAVVAGAFVSAGSGVRTETGADGRFELVGVPTEQHHIVVASNGVGDEFGVVITKIPVPLPAELRIEVAKKRATARVEISLLDRVTGRALEPLGCWLFPIRTDGAVGVGRQLQVRDGAYHDAEAPIGRYRVQAETRDGRRANREIEVAAGVSLVREQLLLDPPGAVRCRLDVSALVRVPARVAVSIHPGNCGRLLVPGRTAGPEMGDWSVVLSPATEPAVEVIGAAPDTPFVLRVIEDDVIGEVAVTVAAGGSADVTLSLLPAGAVQVTTGAPATFDRVDVEWQRADGTWSVPLQLFACRGRQDLGRIVMPAGNTAWRADCRSAVGDVVRRHGRVVVGGEPVRIVVD